MEQKKSKSNMQVISQAQVHVQDDQSDQELEEHTTHTRHSKKIVPWIEPASDEELDESKQFSVEGAWELMFGMYSCQQVLIRERIQKDLQLIVGVNVSQEFPWKQVKYQVLRDKLFPYLDNGETLTEAFYGFNPENHVLIGYAPLLTQSDEEQPDGDPFVFFINSDDTKMALAIIRNIETYERWLLNKRLIKKPRRWVSQGSEQEVSLTLQQRFVEPVDVEIQSVYPLTIPEHKEFKFRLVADVRDGYVELLPSELVKFENIMRKRVTLGIQSAPQRFDLEQQTDPTFPTNAWSQYLYEIKEGDDDLDVSSEEEENKEEKEKERSKTDTPVQEEPKPPPEVSDQIKLLLKTLEFNQVDMYRNDYLLISNKHVEHYTNPYLEETLCFANISKSHQRFVCGIDWYHNLSGLLVTSFTFSTVSTIDAASHKVDNVQRAVLQPNPILMWSFSDNLNYKLEFESPLEVTALVFCVHNSNLLIGGSSTGRVIIWDLQNRAEKLDQEEILTTAQNKYRALIGDFLSWTIQIDEEAIVPPATMTSLEVSQTSAITAFYWLGHQFYVNSYGKVYRDPDKKVKHKFFMCTSMDGSIAFYDLDSTTDKKGAGAARRDQPKALSQSESDFKNKILKPVFTAVYNEPITAAVADTATFSFLVLELKKKRKNPLNYKTCLIGKDPLEMRQSMIISTFYGRIERINWLGLYSDADGRETINGSVNFARVHDGPVLSMKKNPFYPQLFISIGRNVFAIWKEDYSYSPIFWRKRVCDITAVTWSKDRPAVFFITRIDGAFEAWDILARDDDACLNDILGGGIVTAISEHRPSEPEKLIGIGDYNSSFRMIKIPPAFYVAVPNELESFKEHIWKEESRKKSIQAWEQTYFENNRDVIEAKRQAEVDARKEMERIEKDAMLNAARKAQQEAEDIKSTAQPLSQLPYTERMRRLWDKLNLNRLMGILMTRKRVDEAKLERETALEKKRLAYEAAKRDSLMQILQRVGEEVATIRSRILPAEKIDLQRNDIVLAIVGEVMANVEDFSSIQRESWETIKGFEAFAHLEYIDFLHRGEHRRRILNKSLGGNTERLFWYDSIREENLYDDCNWGYEYYVNANADLLARQEAQLKLSVESVPIIYSDSTSNT